MAYGMVVPDFWDDEDLADASPTARLLALFLITGRQAVQLPGLINLGVGGIAEHARLPYEDTKSALAELVRIGFAQFDERARLVRVPNAPKYSGHPNPNCIRGWYRRWRLMPASRLRDEHVGAIRAACGQPQWLDSVWNDTFGSAQLNPSRTIREPFPSGSGTILEPFANGRGEGEGEGPEGRSTEDCISDPDPPGLGPAPGPMASGSSSPADNQDSQLTLVPPPPPPVTEADLLDVYAQYPRKEGKADGLKTLRGDIRDRRELEFLVMAVSNYAAIVEAEERETKYVLKFSTFAGRWRDYLEARAPPQKRSLSARDLWDEAMELERKERFNA